MTQDETLRAIEREAGTSPLARYRWRCALVRAGRHDEAGLEPGDLVLVEEIESPWSLVPWRGIVRKVFDGRYVTPCDVAGMMWRSPWPEAPDRARRIGLYLTMEDRTTLLEPARPEGAERAA